jgi:hypothetical protein
MAYTSRAEREKVENTFKSSLGMGKKSKRPAEETLFEADEGHAEKVLEQTVLARCRELWRASESV